MIGVIGGTQTHNQEWPHKLAKNIGHELRLTTAPFTSTTQVSRMAYDWLNTVIPEETGGKGLIMVIMWPYPRLWSYPLNEGYKSVNLTSPNTEQSPLERRMISVYAKRAADRDYQWAILYQQMFLLSETLKNLGVKYVMAMEEGDVHKHAQRMSRNPRYNEWTRMFNSIDKKAIIGHHLADVEPQTFLQCGDVYPAVGWEDAIENRLCWLYTGIRRVGQDLEYKPTDPISEQNTT